MRHFENDCCNGGRMHHRGPGRHHGRGFGRGRGHGHGQGRGTRRPLGHGDLRLLLLDLIAFQPQHGYGLISEIEGRSGGRYVPSPGVIYPALEVLQDLGFAEARMENGKKTLHVTEAGQAELAGKADELAAIHARLGALSDGEVETDPSDVRSAMRRLRHTVIQTVRSGEAGEAIRAKIAARLNALSDELEADLKD